MAAHSLDRAGPLYSRLLPTLVRRDGWLIWSLARRQLDLRYRGSIFGALWALLSPLMLLALYVLVFSVVLRVKFPGGTTADFALYVFCGLVPYSVLSEGLGTAVGVLAANTNLIKKTPVRSQVFPLSVTLATLMTQLPALLLILLGTAVLQRLGWTALSLPVLIVPLVLLSAGLNVLVAALGLFLRDLAQIITVLMTAWFLITPIFFPETSIPERLYWIIAVNPLAWVVLTMRQTLLEGQQPTFWMVLVGYAVGAALLAGSLWVFERLRPGFPDVL